jgi:LmbE family N-acetylglucosaminyl deacetylase
MGSVNVYSIIGHFLAAGAFIFVAVYVILRRKALFRVSQHASGTFLSVVSINLILSFLQLFRLGIELTGASETIATLNLDWISNSISIMAQSLVIIILFTQKIVVEPRLHPGRVLAIGAHPDDIEIAAGASLARLHDRGYQINGIVMTEGEKGGHSNTRPLEAKKGARFMGLDQLDLHDFTDTRLTEDGLLMTQVIETQIHSFQPDIILTHSPHDLHQDHQAVFEATLRAARNVRTTILCYESPSVTPEFLPTYFIDACGYVDVKIEAVHQHWDQRGKPYMRADLVRSKLAFRGGQAKIEYAEGFEVARMISAI